MEHKTESRASRSHRITAVDPVSGKRSALVTLRNLESIAESLRRSRGLWDHAGFTGYQLEDLHAVLGWRQTFEEEILARYLARAITSEAFRALCEVAA